MKRAGTLAAAVLFLGWGIGLSAQIHGVPPSVTSLGGGHTFFNPPGVPASVTSLGPRGFQNLPCCGVGGGFGFGSAITFGHASNFRPPINRFRHHRFGQFAAPIYVPYSSYVPLYYPLEEDPQAQQQQPIIVELREAPDRYGEHSFQQSRSEPQVQAPAAPPSPPQLQEPTVLVFRDGRRAEVHNYAIQGQILYNFDPKGPRKIQLADLDLDATRKVNDDRGVEFRLPGQ
jgi:hypothetical protein